MNYVYFSVQFWKYAVTGASNNTELKVWSCESWKCHQKINFISTESPPAKLTIKATIDPSSSYLILSDITRKVSFLLLC